MEPLAKDHIRVLFVDDEPGILLATSTILRRDGYQVTAVSTVKDALSEIAASKFDLLISDLNIGHPSDGFTVVSAMRRTQPDCVNLIVTGFPGFETALRALQAQVDDYLIKPVPALTLLTLIEQKLRTREPHKVADTKRVSQIIEDHTFEIVQLALNGMLSDPELGALRIADEQRIEDVPHILAELVAMLESVSPEIRQSTLSHAEQRGRKRYKLGYTAPLLATHVRILERAIYDVIHKNLSSVNLSFFMFELKQLNESLAVQLEHTLKAFMEVANPSKSGQQESERPS
jgi:response regulator RpfG family c-di-GMP phosphodiesterase